MQMDKKLSGVTFMTINNHSMNISLYPQSFWSMGTGDHKPSLKIFTRLMVVVQLLLSFINVIITVPIRYVSVQRFDTKNLMLHQDSSRWTCSSLHRVMPSLVTSQTIPLLDYILIHFTFVPLFPLTRCNFAFQNVFYDCLTSDKILIL